MLCNERKLSETNNTQSYDMHMQLERWSKIVANVNAGVSDLKIKAK